MEIAAPGIQELVTKPSLPSGQGDAHWHETYGYQEVKQEPEAGAEVWLSQSSVQRMAGATGSRGQHDVLRQSRTMNRTTILI